MYVETRTTAAEIFEDMLKELRPFAFRVINGCVTLRQHPTYTSKTSIRKDYERLCGAYEFAGRVFGDDVPSEEIRVLIGDAHNAMSQAGLL